MFGQSGRSSFVSNLLDTYDHKKDRPRMKTKQLGKILSFDGKAAASYWYRLHAL
jgi:hypothetical protein